jgi:hypothetical protein
MNPFDLLEKVNTFYDSAWSKLVIFTSIILAVVGVLIPLIISWFQNRNIQLREESIRRDIISEFETKNEELRCELKKSIDEIVKTKIEELDKRFEERIQYVDAGSYHVQATLCLNNQAFKTALDSYFNAGYCYIKGNETYNLIRVNSGICECLDKADKKVIFDLESDGFKIDNYLKQLEKLNEKGVFTDTIKKIRKQYNSAKERNEKELKV